MVRGYAYNCDTSECINIISVYLYSHTHTNIYVGMLARSLKMGRERHYVKCARKLLPGNNVS